MAGHKWWRIANIIDGDQSAWVSCGYMYFNNDKSLPMNDNGRATASNNNSSDNSQPHYFLNDDASRWTCYEDGGTQWIGYAFEEDVVVNSVTLRMRRDIQPEWLQAWKSAQIQYSDNGNNWFNYGLIFPNIPNGDATLHLVDIVTAKTLDVFVGNESAHQQLNVFSVDESGSFSGLVTQGESGEPKTPLKAEVLLYDRVTNKLMQRTWSDELGAYSFNGLDAGREYYAVTLHPSRAYNAAIQDGLKSGMTA